MKTLTGIRPSLWARCPTAAVYQGRGEEPAPHPPEAEEFFFRGNVFEEIVLRQIAAKHGRDNVQRQVEIDIPGIGTGHADGYLIPDKTLVEVKSTTAPYPSSDTFGYGVKQLRIYLAHHPEAEQGALYMLNPNVMKPADVYTVKLTDEERAEIDSEKQYIQMAVDGGELQLDPHGTDWRPCTKPSQARGRMCPFAHVCFGDDWQPEPVTEVDDPAVLDAAARLYAVKEEIRLHQSAIKALEEGKTAAESELGLMLDEGDTLVGPFQVKKTHVRRQPTFQLKAYEAAGLSVEPLAEFFKSGAEYDTFRVTRAETAGSVDYGEEAPY